jgi:type IV secretory pathway TraG/TraD family ATPase VirD4
MLRTLGHGWTGFLTAYLFTVAGLAVGMRWPHVPIGRHFWRLLPFAFPVMLGAVIGWWIVGLVVGHAFTALPQIVRIGLGLLFVLATGAVVGRILARSRPGPSHQRGTLLVPHREKDRKPGTELTFAGEPVPALDETKHFKLIGTTGTGKSTAIRELLTCALARGDRAVIADPDGSYLKSFYDPGRGDVILNPFHERAARWDLFAEVTQPHDADQLARSLIPDSEGSDRSWRHYARTFLTAILRQLHDVKAHDLAKLYHFLILAPAKELREFLAMTPAGPFLGEDNGKFFESVRSVANVHLAALEHLGAQRRGEHTCVRRLIREGRGVLFLPYKANEIAVLRYLVSTWMRLAIFEAMNAPDGDQKLWFVVDELDALGSIDGLKDALARLRKFGGRCVLGFQSIAQVRSTYGEAEAQTIVENCGNTLILRCSASEHGGTAQFASRLIGQREIIRQQTSRSQPAGLFGRTHATQSVTDQHLTEDAVMASEIEQLPDLTGFVKLASRPEWRRVSLKTT